MGTVQLVHIFLSLVFWTVTDLDENIRPGAWMQPYPKGGKGLRPIRPAAQPPDAVVRSFCPG